MLTRLLRLSSDVAAYRRAEKFLKWTDAKYGVDSQRNHELVDTCGRNPPEMVQINFANREVNCKIVYYGPGKSGKTTNIEVVHAQAPDGRKGKLVSIATEKDRTLYFDFLPIDLGTIAGMTTKFQLYTVPGQVFYDATRKLVLQGADAVVFVADSNPELKLENIESVQNLVANMKSNGLDVMDTPIVFQWNKRDLPEVMPIEEMNADLNPWNAPAIEAVAVNGAGVMQTLKQVATLVIKRLSKDFGR